MIEDVVKIGIIVITAIISFRGFNNSYFFDRYKFNVQAIIRDKQWDRLITSGFLHIDIMHLIFNMFTFYIFASYILNLGILFFFLIYFGSIFGGNLLALLVNKNRPYYSAIGASGGVSGILFAVILLYPNIELMIIPIPIPIPGWLFGIIYLGYSVYGMKKQLGNIGHEAHLGGAIIGIISAVIIFYLYPYSSVINFQVKYLLIMLLPLAALGYEIFREK